MSVLGQVDRERRVRGRAELVGVLRGLDDRLYQPVDPPAAQGSPPVSLSTATRDAWARVGLEAQVRREPPRVEQLAAEPLVQYVLRPVHLPR